MKLTTLLPILAIITLIISGLYMMQQARDFRPVKATSCDNMEDVVERDICLIDEAESLKDISVCERVMNHERLIECINKAKPCEEGYTRVEVPYLTQKPDYYCRVDKAWEEFSPCQADADCEEGLSCIAQMDSEDFRCIPMGSYLMDCYSTPESDVCS